MKTYYVYEIYNSMGTVEYVGETIDPKSRLKAHTRRQNGKFYKRQDIAMYIVAEFTDRKVALELEGQLKQEHGLEWTERIWSKRGSLFWKSCRRLTMDQAKEIRSLYETRKYTDYILAQSYGVSRNCIRQLLNKKTYIE